MHTNLWGIAGPGLTAGLLFAAANAVAITPGAHLGMERLELPFVENAGQWAEPDAAFGARTFGGNAFVMKDGAMVYVVPRFSAAPDGAGPVSDGAVVIRERAMGAAVTQPRGMAPAPSSVNFFVGERARWRSGVPAFAGVDLGEVYPGVRLSLHARGRNVEKVFIVAPGADAGRIRLAIEGVERVRACENGELALATAMGEIRFTAPVAWQVRDGARIPVAAAYAAEGCSYGFRLGPRDPGLPLIIDPLLASTFVGGARDDFLQDMAVDGAGNVYVTGYTWSTDFPVAGSPAQGAARGNTDVFVARLNSSLSRLAAATYLGGPYMDKGQAIAFSSNASAIYVAGEAGAGFPMTAGAYNTNFHAGSDWYVGDAFVARLNTNLSALSASTYLGGARGDGAVSLAVQPSGSDVAVAGWTASPDFPATAGAFDTSYNGGASGIMDAFAAKFNSTLSSLRAATYLGAPAYDYASDIALDAAGYLYVAGHTLSYNFPCTAGAYRTDYYGNVNFYDGFVSKLSPALNALAASTFLGGVNDDFIHALVLDPYGGVLVAGQTDSGDLPVSWGSYDRFLDGPTDAFLARLDTGLSELLASTYLGGADTEEATALALDQWAFVFVAGATKSLRGAPGEKFPVSAAAYNSGYTADGFVSRLDLGLSSMQASTLIGGASNTACRALAVSGTGRLFLAGYTDSDSFPTTPGAYDRARGGSNDAFVAALDLDLTFGDPAIAAPGAIAAGQQASAISIPVCWYGAAGAQCYTLWRSASSSAGAAVRLATTAGTAYHDTSAAGAGWYYYWVSASNALGQSPLAGPALGALHEPAYKDYDGDGKSDMAVFDIASGCWYVMSPAGAPIVWGVSWGWPGAFPVAGDFDGDALSDLAVYDQNSGMWFIRSVSGSVIAWGFQTGSGATPVAMDYNADRKDDPGIFFTQGASAGYWQIAFLSSPEHPQWISWGWPGAWPVWGGYHYSKLGDLAVFDTTSGCWYIRDMDGNTVAWALPWGWPGAIPVSGDYDGDGRFDLAVFDYYTGYWYIRNLAGSVIAWGLPWGWPGALPISGDYDGDGAFDMAVFDTSSGCWYIKSLAGSVLVWAQPWGWPGAWPVGWGLWRP